MNASLQKKGRIYYAVVSIPVGGGKYKAKWVSTRCAKKTEAAKAMRNILNRMENGETFAACPYTFVEYLDYWLREVIRPQIEATTYEGYEHNFKQHIWPYFEPLHLKLEQVKLAHLQQFVRDLHDHGRKDGRGGLSAPSIKKYMANISKALDYAVKVGWIAQNPARYVEYPKEKAFVGSFYTTAEIEKLLEAAKGSTIETPVILATHYGLRRGEILGLRWRDIDFTENTLIIRNTRVRVETEIEKQPKNEASRRTFPLMPSVKEYLLRVQMEQQENARQLGSGFASRGDYVCIWPDGRPLGVDYLNSALTRLLKKNGLRHIRLHDLRHSTASYLNKLGFSPKEIQVWLGHSDIATTMNIYTHIDSGMKEGMARRIDALFGGEKAEPKDTERHFLEDF